MVVSLRFSRSVCFHEGGVRGDHMVTTSGGGGEVCRRGAIRGRYAYRHTPIACGGFLLGRAWGTARSPAAIRIVAARRRWGNRLPNGVARWRRRDEHRAASSTAFLLLVWKRALLRYLLLRFHRESDGGGDGRRSQR